MAICQNHHYFLPSVFARCNVATKTNEKYKPPIVGMEKKLRQSERFS
jgi:hypothetical protein